LLVFHVNQELKHSILSAQMTLDCEDPGCEPTRSGKCTTWVDEALDQMGSEYADAPRPGGCCEKDAQKAREAARILKVVSAADPTAKAAALRAANDPMSPFTQEQLADALDEMDEGDLDSDDLFTDSDDDELGDKRMEDPALREIREKRMRELRAQAQRQQELAQKATYGSAKETDIPKIVAEGPSRVVFHFVLEGSDESARVDEVLDQLAPAFSRTRFVRIRPSTPSPMLATLGATALPAMICFRKKRLGKWTQGLDDFGGVEGFDEEYVSRWLAGEADMLPGHPNAPRVAGPDGAPTSNTLYSSDEETLGPSRRKMEDAEEHSDEEDLCGSCEPCPTCGRRYPHTHVRALRHGGGRAQDTNDGSDDEDSDFD
jgi:hypothetical protein